MNKIELIKSAVESIANGEESQIDESVGNRTFLTSFNPDSGTCETRVNRVNGTYHFALWRFSSDEVNDDWKYFPTLDGWHIIKTAMGMRPKFSFLDGKENKMNDI